MELNYAEVNALVIALASFAWIAGSGAVIRRVQVRSKQSWLSLPNIHAFRRTEIAGLIAVTGGCVLLYVGFRASVISVLLCSTPRGLNFAGTDARVVFG